MPTITEILESLAAGQVDESGQPPKPTPAPRERAMELIEGAQNHPAVGDIVEWRSVGLQTHIIPALGEAVIVTSVFPPMRFQDGDAPLATVAIAMVQQCNCGKPQCANQDRIVELHLDGRRLRKIGSVLN